jgi:hypothetical protein
MMMTHRNGFTLKVFFSLSSARVQALKNPLGNNPSTYGGERRSAFGRT